MQLPRFTICPNSAPIPKAISHIAGLLYFIDHDAAAQCPMHLAWGIAAGLCFDPEEDPAACALQARIGERGVAAVLAEVTGFESVSPVGSMVLEAYRILAAEPQAPFRRLDELR